MTIIEFLILLIIAAFIGSISQALAGYSTGGCLTAIVIGFIGALVGMWLGELFRLPYIFTITVDGRQYPVIWSVVGAVLFLAIIRLITAPARRYDA